MKPFMDENFLLNTETAKFLYHNFAKQMPIADYHCHIDPKEIFENRRFKNITKAWLEADHYKWRAMRSNGTPEDKITGSGSDKEKFDAYAAVMDKCIGNPLYHWSHLELKRYFGFDGCLSSKTADLVWEHCNRRLSEQNMSVRGIIEASNVTHICTTDDPADSLEYHLALMREQSFKVEVLPTWRPDRILKIEADDFSDYIMKLSAVSGTKIETLSDLKSALIKRMDFFYELGCVASDHSIEYAFYVPISEEQADEIFKKGLKGRELSREEIDAYKTCILVFLGEEYAKRNWVMQLHMGPVRNTNRVMFDTIGADTGFDCMGPSIDSRPLTQFMNRLNQASLLPKTILYSLNPNDNALIDSVIGCFQNDEIPGKIQHGSAWWFNDTKQGMRDHLISLASQSLLGNFVGMLTDSRSFLSYTRHEYFRRILCDLIGEWVENGEFPNDAELLGMLVQDICYYNTVRYFGFKVRRS
ncbi:MAG TPA: glucuronate isomerase [Clostridiales bacterium]|nr:glucuronate isomerase [Clostridiales bacterium]